MMQQQELAREQYQRALEQQASQKDVLVRLVENQRDEMERCRDEMHAMRRREADTAGSQSLHRKSWGTRKTLRTSFLALKELQYNSSGLKMCWPHN